MKKLFKNLIEFTPFIIYAFLGLILWYIIFHILIKYW